MAPDVRHLLDEYAEIGSLPMIFVQINEALNSRSGSITDVSRIISDDPGLTARLLRLVNSPLCGFPSRIETISRALVIVGTQQLRDMALATSVIKLFSGIPADLVTMESFWQHSVACALAARILATYRREANVERLFVGGILHDIGRLVLFSKTAEQAREALVRARRDHELLHETERRVIGFNHAQVGSLLVRAWRLPACLEEIVAFHHQPSHASRFPVEATLVHTADILAHALEFGTSGERLVPPLDEAAWERLGIPVSVLARTMDQVARQFSEVLRTILADV
jgi:putative nucleotidyltransferase with HDIG domain